MHSETHQFRRVPADCWAKHIPVPVDLRPPTNLLPRRPPNMRDTKQKPRGQDQASLHESQLVVVSPMNLSVERGGGRGQEETEKHFSFTLRVPRDPFSNSWQDAIRHLHTCPTSHLIHNPSSALSMPVILRPPLPPHVSSSYTRQGVVANQSLLPDLLCMLQRASKAKNIKKGL